MISLITGVSSRPWLIIPVCAMLHITYAIGLLVDPAVENITALHVICAMFGWLAPGFLFLVAFVAMLPVIRQMSPPQIHVCLWPQQFTLFLMTVAAMQAAAQGHYADGTVRSLGFIFADQCFTLYLMLGHFTAVFRNAKYR